MNPRPAARSRHIGLDNPAFRGRLRQAGMPARSSAATLASPGRHAGAKYNDGLLRPQPTMAQSRPQVVLAHHPKPATRQPASSVVLVSPQPYAEPAKPRQERSKVLRRQHPVSPVLVSISPQPPKASKFIIPRRSKLQVALVSMAVFVFGLGVFVSLQTLQTNHAATARVSALAQQTDSQDSGPVPSTQKPSTQAVSNYTVAPALPRYIDIPKLGVHARVLSLGILSSGALAAPDNVFDAGWYTKSALPGQAGAMLLDGHVSSWTTNGVFYGLKNLKEGDEIQITRGDNTKFTYKVVTSQTFSDDKVDMQAALSPISSGKPGLNLITCTGKVKPGTSEFNQRIVVYTEQI